MERVRKIVNIVAAEPLAEEVDGHVADADSADTVRREQLVRTVEDALARGGHPLPTRPTLAGGSIVYACDVSIEIVYCPV
jgi:hypothetical protein